MLKQCLLAAALLSVPSIATAQGLDPSSHGAGQNSCGKGTATKERKCAVVIPEIIVYGLVSDNGPDYDTQGNPIDRYANIVATRGRAGSSREVFAREQHH
jgi:hypothetical protein